MLLFMLTVRLIGLPPTKETMVRLVKTLITVPTLQ